MARHLTSWLYFSFLFLALSTLILTAWAMWVLCFFPYDGLRWSADGKFINFLDPEGPSAQAGIRRGDQILTIDGTPVVNLASLYSEKWIGNRVTVALLRQGQPVTVGFTLAPPPLRELVVRLEPLLVGLVFWGIGLLTWMLRPFDSVIRLFFLVGQVTTGMLAAGDLSAIQLPWAIQLFGLSLLTLAPLVFHFYACFPDPLPARFCHPLLWLVYGVAALLALLTIIDSFFLTNMSALWLVRRSFVALILLAALVLLLRRPRKVSLGVLRRRRLLVAGMVVSLLPLLLFSFLPELWQGSPLVDYTWTFPFLVLLPLTYTYALYQGELGRIDLFLNRSLVYSLLTGLLLALYVLFFFGLDQILSTIRWSQPVIGAGLAVMVAVLYNPIRTRLQQWMDALFYGGWYDYRTVTRTMSVELSQVLDQDQLVERLMNVAETMRFQAAALLWSDRLALVPKGSFGYRLEIVRLLRLPIEGILAQYLSAKSQPCRSEEMNRELAMADLTETERTLLTTTPVHFWLPLMSRDVLRGVLVMGKHQGETLLDREDLDILTAMAKQAALTAENITLIERLHSRLAEVEQMRDELAETQRRLTQSQEAERVRLAQELHDGPVQDLYGVRFHLVALLEELYEDASLAHLAEVLATLRQVTASLRLICTELRPPELAPFGLEMAIRSLAERFQEEHPELEVQVDLSYDGHELQESVRLALFRICQEALNNIVRHAQARHVLIRLVLDLEQVMVEIGDDGQGFVVPQRWLEFARRGHLGLLGAAERAEIVGGRLEVISTPGENTLIRVLVPSHNP